MKSRSPGAGRGGGAASSGFAVCLEVYGEQIGRSGLADMADIDDYAARKCAASATNRFARLPLLLYDLPLNTVLSVEIRSAMVLDSPDVLACTLAGGNTSVSRRLKGCWALPPMQ